MSSERTDKVQPFACVMEAIEPGKRLQHLEAARRLFGTATGFRELPDGYAFRLPDEPATLSLAAEFISLERLCCPFFGFALEVGPGSDAIWLSLTGGEGVKAFIRDEVGGLAPGAPWWRDAPATTGL